MSQHTTISDRLKSIMRTWASCDDPVTVVGVISAACAIWLLKHFGIGNGVEIGFSVDSLTELRDYFLSNYMLFCCSIVGWYCFGLIAKVREWSQRWRLVTLTPALAAVIVSGSLLYLMLGIVLAFVAIGQHLHDTEEQVYQKISGWMEGAAAIVFWIGVVLAGVLLQRNVDPYAMLQGAVTGCAMYAVHWRVTGGLVKGYTQATGNPEGLTDTEVGYLRRFHVGGVTALLLLAQMGEIPLALGYVGTTQVLCIGFTSHYRRRLAQPK